MGIPAFPSNVPNGSGWRHRPGMDLRDWFAGQALAGLLARLHLPPAEAAKIAYGHADEMMRARGDERE